MWLLFEEGLVRASGRAHGPACPNPLRARCAAAGRRDDVDLRPKWVHGKLSSSTNRSPTRMEAGVRASRRASSWVFVRRLGLRTVRLRLLALPCRASSRLLEA